MRLRAPVNTVTGASSHWQGAVEGDQVVRARRLDAPRWLEIRPDDAGCLLLYADAAQQCITDT